MISFTTEINIVLKTFIYFEFSLWSTFTFCSLRAGNIWVLMLLNEWQNSREWTRKSNVMRVEATFVLLNSSMYVRYISRYGEDVENWARTESLTEEGISCEVRYQGGAVSDRAREEGQSKAVITGC